MNILHAIILGIVEGVTEFIPVSSTGHLIIAAHLLGLVDSDFLKTFEIVIQLASILAVAVIYWKRILTNAKLFWMLIVAFIPTAIIGFFIYPFLKSYLLGSIAVVAWALIVGGIIMILFEKIHQTGNQSVTNKSGFWVGVFQTLALIPGVSRSGATIIGGLSLGISRKDIVEFSFMLAIPTILAASGYDMYKNLSVISSSGHIGLLIAGSLAAFISSFIAVKSFLKYMSTHTFVGFGWYRIIIGILVLFFR